MAANAQRTPLASGRRSIASFLARLRTTFETRTDRCKAPSASHQHENSPEPALAAYAALQAQRVWRYAMEDRNGGDWPGFIADRMAAEEQALERKVFGPVSSLAGVVAQLGLLATYLDEDRWVDRTLMERGLLAVRQRRSELRAEARLAVEIAHRLSQIDQRRRGQ